MTFFDAFTLVVRFQGVRDNHQVMAADLLLAAAGLIDPSGNRLHGADGDSTRLDILSKVRWHNWVLAYHFNMIVFLTRRGALCAGA